MRNAVVSFVFAAASFLLSANHADAQWGVGDYPDPSGSLLCGDHVPYWIASAKRVRELGCPLLDGPMWSTDVRTQGDFCLSAGDDGIAARTASMKLAMERCTHCAITTANRLHLIVENVTRRCGFESEDGRWTPDRNFQYTRCILNTYYSGEVGKTIYETRGYDMDEQVSLCKQTHPVYCTGCHNSQSSSALRTTPKAGSVFQDTIQRLKGPTKTSTKSGNDLSSPSGTANRRATSPKNSRASGNDLVKPSGASNNNAAMDRLSGDSQSPTPSSADRSKPRSGGPSATAPKATAAPLPKVDTTVDFGKCASCGKPSSPPPISQLLRALRPAVLA
jgi:hypothetical protein